MIISYEFIQQHVSLTWTEAVWGIEKNLIDWSFLKDMAVTRLCDGVEGPLEIEIAGLTIENSDDAVSLAKNLAKNEIGNAESEPLKKWLYIVLLDLFEKNKSIDDALSTIECIYADFGYPEEIESFVKYMPVNNNYNPLKHSYDENISRLYNNWRQYLVRSAELYTIQSAIACTSSPAREKKSPE